MLKRATQSVIEDETFHIPVEPAATALRTAKCVLDWSSNHKEAMVSFEHRICSALRPCFNGAQISMTSRKEAQEFRLLWKDISAEMKAPHIPAFYQAVTDHIFKEMFVAVTSHLSKSAFCSLFNHYRMKIRTLFVLQQVMYAGRSILK